MSIALAAMIAFVVWRAGTAHAPGCSFYRPASGRLLIAHAGGGLPDRKYPNSIEAMDRSYARGLRTFELDFHQLPFGTMRTGHDAADVLDPRGAWLSEVLAWLRAHPGTRLMVDMKTDNVRGLTLIAARAPDLKPRLIPFVYSTREYDAVRRIGLAPPVYALFHDVDRNWLRFANTHDFAAVAVDEARIGTIPLIRHPAIVYTFDVMVKAPAARAVITNCMVPAPGRPVTDFAL